MTNIYRLALQVQDASNPSGVVNSLANEVMPAIRAEAGYHEQGTSYIKSHPAYILFLDKLVSLSTAGWVHDPDGVISLAYTDARMKAEALEAVEQAERNVCLVCGLPESQHRHEYHEFENDRDRALAQRQADRQAQS